MKQFGLLIFTLLFFTYLFSGCKNEKPCFDQENNYGVIAANVKMGECFTFMKKSEYVVKSYIEFLDLVSEIDTSVWKQTLCDTVSLADTIDFSKYTLLGKYAEGTACSIGFRREVTINSVDSKYIYAVTVYECGSCDVQTMSMNWVLVPRLPENYSVVFEVSNNEQ